MIDKLKDFDELVKHLKEFTFEELLNINEILNDSFFEKSEKVKYEVLPLLQGELDRRFKDKFLNMSKEEQRKVLDDYLKKIIKEKK